MVKLVAALLLFTACEHDSNAQEPVAHAPPGPTQIVVAPAPTPPAPPLIAPKKVPPKRHLKTRADLEGWMLPLPEHGQFTASLGIGGGSYLVVDSDTKKLDARIEVMDPTQKKPPIKKTLAQADVDSLWKLAKAAWQADPPDPSMVTDFREVVVAVDGDDVMIISVHGPMADNEPAQQLARALHKSAGWKW